MLGYVLEKIVGSKNDRDLKKLRPVVEQVNALEPSVKNLTDEQLSAKTAEFRERLSNGETIDDLLPEAFAVVRETAWRQIGERPYDVQVLGAVVLHQGRIAEMRTGEGKTLTSTMPVYLNALTERGVHVVTVNEFLAQRDADWMGQIYKALGMTVGITLEGRPRSVKKAAYECDITYGTNSEFGFDYLRDHSSARSIEEKTQRELHYAIVDEVDSILIDEARTPHIISERRKEKADYPRIARVVARLKKDKHFEIDEKRSKRGSASLTDDGIDLLENAFTLKNLYDPENIDLLHHIMQSVNAHYLYQNDVDYVVTEGRVVIVDEFTGRMQPERRFSDGLHQAIEAKEKVRIVEESQTVARITFQNYFRMYEKLSGMTGTAATEATEFHQIYGLDVVVVPTNMPMIRDDRPDFVFRNHEGKVKAVIDDIEENFNEGRPVLVGTISIEASVEFSRELTKRGVAHRVLNAKEHTKEGEIIAHAGQKHAVTIATNMAGRGVDIKLADGVRELGGLYVIGTERHDSRRIDNQLRGRSGRQGDPGASRFYLSMEDDLMRKFGSDRMAATMDRLGMEEDVPIEHKWLSRSIQKAQERVEQNHFEARKQILKYDNVLSQQRDMVYDLRDRAIEQESLREDMLQMVEDALAAKMDETLPEDDQLEWDIEGLRTWMERQCGVEPPPADVMNRETPRDEIQETLLQLFQKRYEEREKEIGAEVMREIERLILLDRIDYHWMSHLHNIDYIQEGIGFRGYAGRDPLIEFQNEGFALFENMLTRIYEDAAQYVYRIHLQTAPQQPAQTGGRTSAAAAPARRAPRNSAGKKVGRNAPCPCGSGRKFKLCCGRNA